MTESGIDDGRGLSLRALTLTDRRFAAGLFPQETCMRDAKRAMLPRIIVGTVSYTGGSIDEVEDPIFQSVDDGDLRLVRVFRGSSVGPGVVVTGCTGRAFLAKHHVPKERFSQYHSEFRIPYG